MNKLNSFMGVSISIFFFITGFYSVFYTASVVNILMQSYRRFLESQNYSLQEIEQLTDGKKWYLFYRILGVFALIITPIGFYSSLVKLLK